eukprot:g3907.t1
MEDDLNWAFTSLVSPDLHDGHAIRMRIPDTVFLDPETGQPKRWLFTDHKTGNIKQRRPENAGWTQLRDRFMRLAQANDPGRKSFVCVAFSEGRKRPVDRASFAVLLSDAEEGKLEGVTALQAYVRPKKQAGMFRCTYFFDKEVQEFQFSTVQVSKGGTSGSHMVHVNRALEEQTAHVVRFIEEAQRVQIDSLAVDFVVDKRDNVYLSGFHSIDVNGGIPRMQGGNKREGKNIRGSEEEKKGDEEFQETQISLLEKVLENTGVDDSFDDSTVSRPVSESGTVISQEGFGKEGLDEGRLPSAPSGMTKAQTRNRRATGKDRKEKERKYNKFLSPGSKISAQRRREKTKSNGKKGKQGRSDRGANLDWESLEKFARDDENKAKRRYLMRLEGEKQSTSKAKNRQRRKKNATEVEREKFNARMDAVVGDRVGGISATRMAETMTALSRENAKLNAELARVRALLVNEEDLKAALELSESKSQKAEIAKENALQEAKDAKKKVATAQLKFMEVLREKDNETERRMLQLESKLNAAMAQRGGDVETDMRPVRDLIAQVEELQIMMDRQTEKFARDKQEMVTEHEEAIVKMRKAQRFTESSSERAKSKLREEIKNSKQQIKDLQADLAISVRKAEDLRMRLDLESEKLGAAEKSRGDLRQTIQSLEQEIRARDNGEERSDVQSLKAHNSSKIRQLTNEIDFLRVQMASESKCKEELAASLAAVNEQFVVAKSAAKNLLQQQEEARRQEIREMEDTFRRKVDMAKQETSRMEDKVKRLQLQMTEMMKDAAAARKKFQTMEQENLIVTQEKQLLTERLEQANSMLSHASDEQERHAKTSQMEGAIKSTMELRMRQIENEATFVRKQLAAEVELREDLEKALKEAAKKVSDVEYRTKNEKEDLRLEFSKEMEKRRQQDIRQENALIDMEGRAEKLKRQLDDTRSMYAKEKDQHTIDKRVLDATQAALVKAQEELSLEKKASARMKEQMELSQKSQKRTMNSVQSTLDSLQQQKSGELAGVKKQLSNTLQRLSNSQQTMVDLRKQLAVATVGHKKRLAAQQIFTVMQRCRKVATATFFAHWRRAVAQKNLAETLLRAKEEELLQSSQAAEQEKAQAMRVQADNALQEKLAELRVMEEEHANRMRNIQDERKRERTQIEEAAALHLHNQIAITARDVAERTKAVWEKKLAEKVKSLSEESSLAMQIAMEEADTTKKEAEQQLQAQHKAALEEIRHAHEKAVVEAIEKTKTSEKETADKARNIMIAEHAEKIRDLRAEHLQVMADTVAEHAASHDAALLKKCAEYDEELRLTKLKNEELVKQLEADANTRLEREIQSLKEEHTKNLEENAQRTQEKMDDLEKLLREEGEKAQSEAILLAERKHQQELEQVRSDALKRENLLNEKIGLAKQAADQAVAGASNATASLGVSHAQKLRNLEMQHDVAMKQAIATQNTLREQSLKEQKMEYEMKIEKLKEDHALVTKELENNWKSKMEKSMILAREQTEKLLAQLQEDKENALQNAQDKADEALQLMAKQSQQALAVAVAAEQRKCMEDKQVALQAAAEEAEKHLSRELQSAKRGKEEELRVMEEKMSNLMVQAATRAAEDQVKALDEQRLSLEEEQRTAVAELKKESDQLISSFERALEQLRDEAAETEGELEDVKQKLEESEDHAFDLEKALEKMTKAGSYLQLRLSTMYVQWMAATTKIEKYHEEEVQRILHECKLDKEAACERLEHELKKQAERITSMEGLRKSMQNALVNHKREMLMEHKVQSTVIQSDITQIAKEKVMIEAEHREHLQEMSALEGGLKHMEVEIRDMSRRSAISKDGEVDTDYMRKKRRLDSKFESCLKQIATKRKVLKECEDRLSDLEDRHQVKEDELKELETGLVTLLVQQQKRMLQIISNAGGGGKMIQKGKKS